MSTGSRARHPFRTAQRGLRVVRGNREPRGERARTDAFQRRRSDRESRFSRHHHRCPVLLGWILDLDRESRGGSVRSGEERLGAEPALRRCLVADQSGAVIDAQVPNSARASCPQACTPRRGGSSVVTCRGSWAPIKPSRRNAQLPSCSESRRPTYGRARVCSGRSTAMTRARSLTTTGQSSGPSSGGF